MAQGHFRGFQFLALSKEEDTGTSFYCNELLGELRQFSQDTIGHKFFGLMPDSFFASNGPDY